MKISRNLLIALTCMSVLGAGAAILIQQNLEPSTAAIGSAAPLGKTFGTSSSAGREAAPGLVEIERAAVVNMTALHSEHAEQAPPKKAKVRPHPRMPATEAEVARLRAAARNQPVNHLTTQVREAEPLGGEGAVGYFAKGAEFAGPNGGDNPGTLVPPDPELAVGPNHVVAAVNVRIHIYNRSGTLLAGVDTDTFFGVAGGGCTSTFDPNALYDEEEDRWVLGIDGNGTNYCVAFSQTADPTGVWNVYSIPTNTGGAFFDYPHAGLSDDLLVMGSNQFGGGAGFEARVWAMDKNDGYAGISLTFLERTLGTPNGTDTPQPMHSHGMANGTYPIGPDHYIIAEDFSGPTFEVWKWTDPLGTASAPAKVATLNWPGGGGFPINSPTKGGQTLTGNDWRPQDAEYYNGSIWTTRHVSCNPGGGTVMCQGWAEVDLSTLTVRQGGILAKDKAYMIFGDIAPNACGDALLGYTVTNANVRPTQALSAHLASKPLNTMGGFVIVEQGSVDYNAFDGSPHRWGDYTGATPDPNGTDFWYLGQISEGSNASAKWGTNIVQVTSACSPL